MYPTLIIYFIRSHQKNSTKRPLISHKKPLTASDVIVLICLHSSDQLESFKLPLRTHGNQLTKMFYLNVERNLKYLEL